MHSEYPDPTLADPLAELARETGGNYYIANTLALAPAATRTLLDELPHQYVLAFESAQTAGLPQVEIRMRRSRLVVTSRRWYLAGTGE